MRGSFSEYASLANWLPAIKMTEQGGLEIDLDVTNLNLPKPDVAPRKCRRSTAEPERRASAPRDPHCRKMGNPESFRRTSRDSASVSACG